MLDELEEATVKLAEYGFTFNHDNGMTDFFHASFPEQHIITYVHTQLLREMFYFLITMPEKVYLAKPETELNLNQVVEQLDKLVQTGAPKSKVALLLAIHGFNYRVRDYSFQNYVELVQLDELEDGKKFVLAFMNIPASDFYLFTADVPFNLALEMYREAAHD
jgi:hypothetical protein